ncbi:hypothetical protein QUF58_04055 [Anaerolineales bacterium HSG24]|nr:hypothetical protein [Anaerolineales bacterium HSG24]
MCIASEIMVGARQGGLDLECATISAPSLPRPSFHKFQGEARRIGVLISNQRYTALPSPYVIYRHT